MQFTISAAFLALIGSAFAQTANFDAITVPTKGQELVADGKTSYTITWDPTAEYDGQDVSILLLQGASQDTLDFYPGADVASSIDSALGEYTWTPDSSIAGYATYGLKLQLDSDTTIFQYSFPFKIKAGSDSSTTATESSSSSTTLSSVSSTTSVSAAKTASTSSSSSSSAAATVVSNNDDSVSTVTTPVSASATSATLAATGAGSATGSGAQSTLTTATKSSSTGSATSSSTSAVVTAGAGRVVAGGFAAIGGVVAAVLAL